jgi:C4-dicarboxylate-specific signal transduction histidine kinase
MLGELESLRKNIDHIKQIVSMQQNYAKVAGVVERLTPKQLLEDAIHINEAALTRHGVKLEIDIADLQPILTEKHKVLQILVNLVRNAKYAVSESKQKEKRVLLRAGLDEAGNVRIQVIDNGMGISAENLTRIFGHGFTTRADGHGFGLHSSALAARDLGGSLTAQSEGEGKGATFTLTLPQELPSAIAKAA